MMRAAKRLGAVLLFVMSAAPLFAQAPARDGRLIVTVVDQTRAVTAECDGHRQRYRGRDQAHRPRAGADHRSGRGDADAAARTVSRHRGVSRLRDRHPQGCPHQARRQPADDRPRHPGSHRFGHGWTRQAGSGGRSQQRIVRHRADPRSGGRALGRSDRDGAAAPGHDRRRRHSRRQLRGRAAAAEGDDQVDPRDPRRVRGREPQRRRSVHRHHHAAWSRTAARRRPL